MPEEQIIGFPQPESNPNVYLAGAERVAQAAASVGEKALETSMDSAMVLSRHLAGTEIDWPNIFFIPLVAIETEAGEIENTLAENTGETDYTTPLREAA